MRSEVAEIFHSLSRKSFLASSANSSSCGPNTIRIGASDVAGSSTRRSAAPLAGGGLQFVAGLEWPRIGAAETGARVHGQTAEHRLALHAAFDREVAERTATGKTECQRLAIRQRHRCIRGNGASGDVGIARGARQRDADGAA